MELSQLLNPKQLEAATYLDGHLRIIAGAGSGKTRVVTYRIAYLIEEVGVNPHNILAITFTNKAANEMKTRVENILGTSLGTTICTIHSLCVRVLRQHSTAIGYPHNFIIMDEEDQKSLIKKLYKEKEIDQKSISIKSMINYISSYKVNFVSPAKAVQLAGNMPGEKHKAEIYAMYEKYKEDHNMMDFDDLLVNTLKIFQDNPDIVSRWSRRYQFVHVDEFQDVGSIEYNLIHYFAQDSIVCVVGDPDQTIYSFRGSDVNYIMNFDKDYQNVKTVILDQNYRSTKTILDISNNLIKKNKNRLEKDLFSELEEGDKVIHYAAVSEDAESKYICDTIQKITQSGVSESHIAVLYRANYLSRSIEQEMIRRQIPYKIFGGLKFFNRKEVKDALSYIRLVVMGDDLSFERVVNTPSRGIGAKTLEKITLTASRHGISNYEAVCFFLDETDIGGKAKKGLKELVEVIEKARVSDKSLADIYEDLLKDTGYLKLMKDGQEDNRIENLMELKNSIDTYVNTHPETPDFESYLQDIALYTSQDEEKTGDYVSLMSIHMAKGLEFDYVFVSGLSEGIFPSERTMSEGGDEGLEEERRLAYVAFTRAKKRLYLTDSQGFSFVSQSPKVTSRFVDEIGRNHVEHVGRPSKFKTRNYVHESYTDLIGDNGVNDWKVGDLVNHDIFGKGVVVKVNGPLVDVAFEVPHGIKTLMGNHHALKRLSN